MKPKFARQNASSTPNHQYAAMLATVGNRSPAAKTAPQAIARASLPFPCARTATSATPPVSAAGTAGTYLIQVAIPNANPAAAKDDAIPIDDRVPGARKSSSTPVAVNGARMVSVIVAIPPARRVEKAT